MVAPFGMYALRQVSIDLAEFRFSFEYLLCSIAKFNYHKTRHQASASMYAGRVSELSRYEDRIR